MTLYDLLPIFIFYINVKDNLSHSWVFKQLSVLPFHIIIKVPNKRHQFFFFLTHENILPSSADQRGLSRMPGARSIIPGSHFHCPLLLTHQKNLGPIKGWRGHQPAKQAISPPILLQCYLLLLIFFSPAIIPLSYFTLSFSLFSQPLIQLHTIA